MQRKLRLIAQLFSDEQDFDAFCRSASSGDDNLAADAVFRQAVCADSGGRAWSVQIQADAVWRRRHILDAAHGVFCGRDDFVHSGYDNDLFRAVNQCGDAVSISVDIDKLPV